MRTRYDAIIIGAAIIRACTALELARRGWRIGFFSRLREVDRESSFSVLG